ncbi:hypothetical protein [Ralstonia pseudosolanacearum]|uniref:hypothetical protein n=1 Tax=Ralstonia pseudosolanacearum TaxID=1310165 RepID=UPI003CFB1842
MADSDDLKRDLLDIHRIAWRNAGSGPIDRRPSELRPDWLGGLDMKTPALIKPR